MGFLKTSKTSKSWELTPEQQAAMKYLTDYGLGGQTPYTGDFNLDVGLGTLGEAKQVLGKDYGQIGFLQDLISKGGLPVDQTASYQAQRAAVRPAITRAVGDILSNAEKAGARFSSAAASAAAQRAAETQGAVEASILQQEMAAQERARQRQLMGAQILAGIQQSLAKGLTDIGRIQTAAEQWQKGMDYEEFKRMYPDVYQVLLNVFGRNVQQIIEQRPNALGNFLNFAGAVANIAGQFINPSDSKAAENKTTTTGGGG